MMRVGIVTLSFCLVVLGVSAWALRRPLHSATGFTAHVLCSQTFVAGRDPNEIFSDYVLRTSGTKQLSAVLKYEIDPVGKGIRANVAGLFESRAVYRDGRGCTLVHGEVLPAAIPSDQTSIVPVDPLQAPIEPVRSSYPAIDAAIDRAFAETPGEPYQDTKAVIVVHDDRIIAERYAVRYGPESRMQSWSMAKSVTNAMIGALIREGRLSLDDPAPVAVWRAPADPRHAVTIDQLLRQTSGQPFGSAGGGFGESARMQFMESDTATFAAAAAFSSTPGVRWSYTDGHYAILSGIVRDTVGGKAEDVVRFARREIFAPAGVTSVVQEFDEAGAPMGGSYVYATPRDWARLALLYLHDGAAGDRQVLPVGWAAYSARPTPQAWVGYGAGFWTNLGSSTGATLRRSWGAPADSFFADGDFGQHVLIVPSEHLILGRFGFSQDREGFRAQKRISVLAGEVVQALRH